MVECFDGFARITSKELASTHSVKSGTLQNACSTRPRAVVGLGKSARSHIVRLMNNLVKGPKNDDKSAVAMLKKNDWHKNVRQPVVNRDKNHDRSGRPDKNRDHEEAAEIYFTEELRHAETNPTCEIHESYCASH